MLGKFLTARRAIDRHHNWAVYSVGECVSTDILWPHLTDR